MCTRSTIVTRANYQSIRSRDADLGVILSHSHEFQLHPSGLTSCYLNLENAAERTFLSLGHTSKAKKE